MKTPARLSERIRSFRRGREAVTAVEFALILPVYVYLLFGILEMSLLFFTTTMVDEAVRSAARTLRTGQAQLSGSTLTTFQTQLCASLVAYDCDNITLDVTTFDTFSNVEVPVLSYNEDGDLVDEDGNLYNVGFSAGGSGEITVVRVLYSWEFLTPLFGELMSDNGTKTLSTTAVFRNEPYE